MKVVVEVANGEILGVTADAKDVELLVVDYDLEGAEFDGQACRISRHEAVVDASKVAEVKAAQAAAPAAE